MTISLALFLAATAAAAPVWPVFRGGPQNRGATPVALGDARSCAPACRVERVKLGGLIWGTPVIGADGAVYVGTADKTFHAVGPDGRRRWSHVLLDRPDSLVDSAAALSDDLVVVPGGDGHLHALDARTGKPRWLFKAFHAGDAAHTSGVVVDSFEGNVQVAADGSFLAGSDNGHLYAVGRDGALRWFFATKMMVWSSPAVDPAGRWLAFGSLDGNLYLLDPATGAELSRFKAKGDVKSSPAYDGRDSLYFGDSGGVFHRLRVREDSGRWRLVEDWSFDAGSEIYSSAALGADHVVFGTAGGEVVALKTDGALLWRYRANSPVLSSPLLTADGKALLGAGNGKLYALDARTGERVWSYRAQNGRRANLDSSPALDARGAVWVGSYAGNLLKIPGGYCAARRDDPNCEFGGTEDLPDSARGLAPDDAALRFEDSSGRFPERAPAVLPRAEPVRLRLGALAGGSYRADRALSASGLGLRAWKNDAEVPADSLWRWRVSSDGRSLELLPRDFLPSGADLRLSVTARHYRQTNWLADRLRWFGLEPAAGELAFRADTARPAPPLPAGGWLARSLTLVEPRALDTFIPAALDGQAFVARPLAAAGAKRFPLLIIPVLPTASGASVLAEPSRAAVLDARLDGEALLAEGAFRLSAMGGDIPFDDFRLSATLAPDGTIASGALNAAASCLRIKGSGSSYRFPLRLINRVCDGHMRMFGHLTFESRALRGQGCEALPLNAALVGEAGAWSLAVTPPEEATSDRLLFAVLTDASGRLVSWTSARLQSGPPGPRRVDLSSLGSDAPTVWRLTVFVPTPDGRSGAEKIFSSGQ